MKMVVCCYDCHQHDLGRCTAKKWVNVNPLKPRVCQFYEFSSKRLGGKVRKQFAVPLAVGHA